MTSCPTAIETPAVLATRVCVHLPILALVEGTKMAEALLASLVSFLCSAHKGSVTDIQSWEPQAVPKSLGRRDGGRQAVREA